MLRGEGEMASPNRGFCYKGEMPARLGPDTGQPPETWSTFKLWGIFLL